MKIQLLFFITALWLLPSNGEARICQGPTGLILSNICTDSADPVNICEKAGFKFNNEYIGFVYCMDKNCLLANETACQLCSSDRMYVKGKICEACPSNAICDGQNIVGCSSGMFINGSQCAYCHSSCKTCSGAKENNCTSCDSRTYLSGGQCIDCPSNATCDGSSYFTCNTGYSKADGACVADQQEPAQTNTVNSCPSRMTLSADGCCCINK